MKEPKTLEGILSDTYKKYGWVYQPKIVGGCPHEHIALEAMKEYSDQQNAALERVKELEAGLAYSIEALKACYSLGASKPIIERLEKTLKK